MPTRRPHVLLVNERVKPGGLPSHVSALMAGYEAIGWRVSHLNWGQFSTIERAWVALPNYGLDRLHKGLGHRWLVPAYTRILERKMRRLAAGAADLDVLNLQEAYVVPVARRAVPGVPIALTVHGPWHREVASGYGLPLTDPTVQWLREIERQAYLDADAVISVDQAHADYVRAFGRKDRVWVIPNFVDTRRFHPGLGSEPLPPELESWIGGRPVVLCPRILVPKNGVDVAIEAMKVLRDRSVACVLMIAGDGPQREALQEQVRANALERHVRFLGLVLSWDMPRWCGRASAIVVPSVSSKGVEEATSIAALEGQACGLPVVVSALGGLREIVTDGVTGLWSAPGDPQALAGTLQRVLSDPNLAKRLGAAGAARIRDDHSHIAGARRFVEVFRAIGAPS